jgi:hypothetical protein
MHANPLHRRLTDAGARYSPRFERLMSNHLPMTLHALATLGATEQQLDGFTTYYASRLATRGSFAAFEIRLAHYELLVRKQGAQAVLQENSDRLMPYAGADAFHGLIRLGHALAAQHEGELMHALAYWDSAGFAVHPARFIWPAPVLNVDDWITQLLKLPASTQHADFISERMQRNAQRADFAVHAFTLMVFDTYQTVEQLAIALATLYACSANFTVLHGLTSLWALRMALPYCAQPEQAVREYSAALAAALLSAGRGVHTVHPCPTTPTADWLQVIAAACCSLDDHVPKLVYYTCRAFAGVLDNPVFLHAAVVGVAAHTPKTRA